MQPSSYVPVIASLEGVPSIFVPLIKEVPDQLRKRRPFPKKWSAHEHACHLAAVQPMFFDRLDLMLHEDHPTIRPYFPDQDEEDGAMLTLDLEQELDRFAKDRARLVGLLKGLSDEDWDRTAEHGEYNRYSIFILFRHVVMHDMLHAYRVEELLLMREWDEAQ